MSDTPELLPTLEEVCIREALMRIRIQEESLKERPEKLMDQILNAALALFTIAIAIAAITVSCYFIFYKSPQWHTEQPQSQPQQMPPSIGTHKATAFDHPHTPAASAKDYLRLEDSPKTHSQPPCSSSH